MCAQIPVYDARLNYPMGQDVASLLPANPFPAGIVVVDAAGEWVAFVRRCNLETGDVERYERKGEKFVLGPDRRCAIIREKRPAPLTFRPAEEYLR